LWITGRYKAAPTNIQLYVFVRSAAFRKEEISRIPTKPIARYAPSCCALHTARGNFAPGAFAKG